MHDSACASNSFFKCVRIFMLRHSAPHLSSTAAHASIHTADFPVLKFIKLNRWLRLPKMKIQIRKYEKPTRTAIATAATANSLLVVVLLFRKQIWKRLKSQAIPWGMTHEVWWKQRSCPYGLWILFIATVKQIANARKKTCWCWRSKQEKKI